MPVALDGVFCAILLFVVGSIWRQCNHHTRADSEWIVGNWILWLIISIVFLFIYEWCMGRV